MYGYQIHLNRKAGRQPKFIEDFDIWPCHEQTIKMFEGNVYKLPVQVIAYGKTYPALQDISYKYSQRRGDYIQYNADVYLITDTPFTATEIQVIRSATSVEPI